MSQYTAHRVPLHDIKQPPKMKAGKAWEMWQSGMTWQAIADVLGYKDRSGPWRAVRRAANRHDRDQLLKGLSLI